MKLKRKARAVGQVRGGEVSEEGGAGMSRGGEGAGGGAGVRGARRSYVQLKHEAQAVRS